MYHDKAAQIEKEYGSAQFRDPGLYFDFNLITIRHRIRIMDKIFIAIGLISMSAVFIIFNLPLLFYFVFLFIVCVPIIVEYYDYFDRVEIDFMNHEIRLKNSFPLVNAVRKMFKNPLVIRFDEIHQFETESIGFWQSQARKILIYRPGGNPSKKERRTALIVKSYDHMPLEIARFRWEKDARKFGELLQQYVKGQNNMSNIALKSGTAE